MTHIATQEALDGARSGWMGKISDDLTEAGNKEHGKPEGTGDELIEDRREEMNRSVGSVFPAGNRLIP